MDTLANGEFCANTCTANNGRLRQLQNSFKTLHKHTGDERFPAAVDAVIRQGLPLLATMDGIDAALGMVKLFETIAIGRIRRCNLAKQTIDSTPMFSRIVQNVVVFDQACNAVEGTCSGKKRRLF